MNFSYHIYKLPAKNIALLYLSTPYSSNKNKKNFSCLAKSDYISFIFLEILLRKWLKIEKIRALSWETFFIFWDAYNWEKVKEFNKTPQTFGTEEWVSAGIIEKMWTGIYE